jgi:hypothetical protein
MTFKLASSSKPAISTQVFLGFLCLQENAGLHASHAALPILNSSKLSLLWMPLISLFSELSIKQSEMILLLSRSRLCHYSVWGGWWHLGFYESF